ncbi:NUDIX domain-containing protein [Pedobacter deserti]|uniref:NUDIX domain-containing protein n=1 Tax=Pedobacter deserti TaxID=2817382 RepID=UPI00210BCB28|nr:NUDIX domain-containing protein [Pedobacter sp. SYSU D00382]
MAKQSAGILLYRKGSSGPEFLLAHPGGPFFRNKDAGVWTIPKGEPSEGEALFDAAIREFEEETGHRPVGDYLALQPIVQKAGKEVHAWAVEGDFDPDHLRCNTFEMEWPPRSGKMEAFEEVNKVAWFSYTEACQKINERQRGLLTELLAVLQNHGANKT